MLRSSLCDYSDSYILVSGTITVAALAAGGENNNLKVVIKNCAPFTNCLSEINNTQIDHTKDIDVVMAMYNLREYSDNYSKHQEIYGNTIGMNQVWLMLGFLIIFLVIKFRLSLSKNNMFNRKW